MPVKTIEELEALFLEFETAHQIYPGVKRGVVTEFKQLQKKHKDWEEIVPVLKMAIELQAIARKKLAKKKEFIPGCKHFQTYINNRSWESQIG